jgi:uncharacterized OB-fold protein
MSGVEGRWMLHVCKDCGERAHGPGSRCAKDRRRTWTEMREVPVVPCDEAAVERGTDALIRQEGFEPDEDSRDAWREHARAVLRAAGAVEE